MTIIYIILCFIYNIMIEYISHRWFMHKSNPFKTKYYVDHHIEHHANKKHYMNLDITYTTAFILGIPLYFLGYYMLGISGIVISLLHAILYATTWNILHRAHHDINHTWIKKIPFYSFWRKHHLDHHNHVGKNFGTVYIFSDYIFGTKI